ncbi:MAG: CehA/McbA family metallohydrolase [Myxococcota bacterium]
MRWWLPLLLSCACVPSASREAFRAADLKAELVSGSPPGLPLEDDQQWHITLFGLHTTEGPWRYENVAALKERTIYDGVQARKLLRLAASRGVQVVVITDHNSLQAAFDKELNQEAERLRVTLVSASEWSLGGPLTLNELPVTPGVAGPHAVLVGYQASRPSDVIAPPDTRLPGTDAQLVEMLNTVHARGGAAVLTHPNALNADYPFATPLQFDLVEVDGPRLERPGQALSLWHGWLMDGYRLGAISSANWHGGRPTDNPFRHLNLVRARTRTPGALAEAIRAGHVMVVAQPEKRPRVLLGADADEDGSFDDVREGDVMTPGPRQERARFQVRVVGAEGRTLVLYTGASREPAYREDMFEPEVVRSFSLALMPERRTFVRAELWNGTVRQVLTNPVYFEPLARRPSTPDVRPKPEPEPQEPIRIITVPDRGAPPDAGGYGVQP